jgi:hypothetical protein
VSFQKNSCSSNTQTDSILVKILRLLLFLNIRIK